MSNYDFRAPRTIDEMKAQIAASHARLYNWINPSVSYEDFIQHFKWAAQNKMADRGIFREYEFDDYNIPIIKQLFYYISGNKQCEWNIHKGLFIGGKVGCGKTLLLETFCWLINIYTPYLVEVVSSTNLAGILQNNDIKFYKQRPMMIDDVGRESLEANVWGTKIHPVEDLISLRYQYGARTFMTSNFKVETLCQGYNEKGEKIGYGAYIGDRIKEMCNIIVMKGESRRK